jgi:hypothetical protein
MHGILACVFIDVALKIVSFDSAARVEVLGIEVKHYPFALELIKRHLHPSWFGRVKVEARLPVVGGETGAMISWGR